MTSLTPSQRLEALDERSAALKHAFLEAAEALDRSEHVPGEVTERLKEQTRQVSRLPDGIISTDLDREQLDSAWRALWQMRELLDQAGDEVDLDTLDGLLVAVERFRHVVRDALDEYVPGIGEDTAIVVGQLREWLPSVPKSALAELLGVQARTVTRWQADARRPSYRLGIVAKLVAILRHSWTQEGVRAWFYRPREDLDGRRPFDLLDKPEDARALVSAARSTRSMYAS